MSLYPIFCNPKIRIEELNKIITTPVGYIVNADYMPIERFYRFKSLLEEIWGKETYLHLKHCSDLRIWKEYASKTLDVSLIAIEENVKIKDDDWQKEIKEIINNGLDGIKGCTSFDCLFSCISSTYIRLSFCQIGFFPITRLNRRSTKRRSEWKLDMIRSVQYVQSNDQKQYQEKYNKVRGERSLNCVTLKTSVL